MFRRPPRSTRPDTLFPDTTLFRSSDSADHPDVETLYERASALDSGISIATVYRTVRLCEEAGILDRHDFGDGRSRYEAAPEAHHDHLIDVETGKVIEFVDPELEALQKVIDRKSVV